MSKNIHNHTHEYENGHDDHGHTHGHSIVSELMCHLPYAVFSVAFCLAVISILGFLDSDQLTGEGGHVLFHSFHFMHVVFAATGSLITFFRFSRSYARGLVVGIVVPAVFCVLSDSILPYIGGLMLGVDMHFHICFIDEIGNVLPFLIAGIVNGFVMSHGGTGHLRTYSLFSHFVHILVSALASTLYLVSHGFADWHFYMGYVFIYLIGAVVIPCTLADVVVPMMCARIGVDDTKKASQ